MVILQKQIAEKAGVSYATVSRAFTNSAKVKPQTMQRIRNAMLELGITNSDDVLLGKSFVSRTILLVVSDISNNFYSKVVKGVCDVLTPHGYSIILCNCGDDGRQELESLRKAVNQGLSGIILVTVTESEECIHFLQSSSIPVVLVNRYIQALDLDVIRIDNYRGGYMAAQHLIDHGHRRIAILGGIKGAGTTRDRVRGFQDAEKNSGITCGEENLFYGNNTVEGGRIFADQLLRMPERYSAIFVANDYMAVGMVKRLTECGKRIPEDYSVICFDDSLLVDENSLNLTVVHCDPEMMGRSAADVFEKRRNNLLGDRYRISYSPRFIERRSVAPPKKY